MTTPLDPAVNTGKPSLKRRLEDYYRLVHPDTIKDETEWRKRFVQIYDKFGGSFDGERQLQRKLIKKYGTAMILQIVEPVKKKDAQGAAPSSLDMHSLREEHWFRLTTTERQGCIDMLSNKFDPEALLQANEKKIAGVNPWFSLQGKILDRVDVFSCHLPREDPLYRPPPEKRTLANTAQKNSDSTKTITKDTSVPSIFAGIVNDLQEGPYALLYRALQSRQRARVVIRYVNHVRGTITGQLIAYDKHFNLILRDADEVYSPRVVSNEEGSSETLSNLELELLRRQRRLPGVSWDVRQRRLPQVMIRGDNLVSLYLAREERSAWPQTAKSPITRYRSQSATVVPPDQRIGTPGAISFRGKGKIVKGSK